jgi:hypothetical protein
MIIELKEHKKFQSICPISEQRANRGEYEEFILRFFAYKDKYLESPRQSSWQRPQMGSYTPSIS